MVFVAVVALGRIIRVLCVSMVFIMNWQAAEYVADCFSNDPIIIK